MNITNKLGPNPTTEKILLGGDCPPTDCSSCASHLESSDLEWVKVGGMNVGMHRQPLEWRLRDKYSSGVIQQNALYSQRLAAAARLIHALKDHVDDAEMLGRMERFLKPNNNDRSSRSD